MADDLTINPDNPTLEQEAAAMDEQDNATPEEPKLAGEEDTPDRPEWLPEKFKSPEDMAKAYSELEKTLGSKDSTAEEKTEAAEAAVEGAGLDMDALSAEYATNGELTQESLDKLAEVGIRPEMVDAYIAGQELQSQEIMSDLLEGVGGERETYDEMVGWAADNLPEQDIDNFNSVLESGNTAAIKLAVNNLAAKYADGTGVEPGNQLTGRGNNEGAARYESTADLMKDMQNPEYRDNPAFRAKVEQKLGRSDIM